jgi:uncharacterized membrane protein YedE/YeeE
MIEAAWSLPVAGLAIGAAYGWLVQRSGFCTMGAISDVALTGDWRRIRAWAMAVAVAIVGTQALVLATGLDVGATGYVEPRIAGFGQLVGGGVFGFGMVFAGGCLSRNLVRAGGGDLRALMVVVVAAGVALLSFRGPLAPVREVLREIGTLQVAGSGSGLGDVVAALTGLEARHAAALVGFGLASGLVGWCLGSRRFRGSAGLLASAIGIGVAVAAGWAATAALGDPFEARPQGLQSMTFVGPSARVLAWAAGSATLDFAVALVLGTALGAAVAAFRSGQFRLHAFADGEDFARCAAGALLMGFGGATAAGCTIGQGLSALSVLSIGGLITTVGLIGGARLGLAAMSWLVDDDGD